MRFLLGLGLGLEIGLEIGLGLGLGLEPPLLVVRHPGTWLLQAMGR